MMGPKQCIACESLVEVPEDSKPTPRAARMWRGKCNSMGTMWTSLRATMLDRRSLLAIIVLCCVGIVMLATSRNVLNPGPWHSRRMWHYPIEFPRCSMDVCFNFSRCEHGNELLIYTYNEPAAPDDNPTFFNLLPTSKYHTNDPEKACLFFYFSDSVANQDAWTKPDPKILPFWNGGLNHVFVTFADHWEQTNPPARSIGMASILSTELHYTTYRPHFDIAIPLPRLNSNVKGLAELKPFDRKYFLTFKGTRYLSREGNFRSNPAFRGMHNGEDVIIATTCNHETNNKLLRWQPWRGTGCEEDQILFDRNDYTDLMNTTFGLAPAGRSPASYRMLEVLSAGAIPVLVADNYVKPFDTLIQWPRCLLQFPTNEIHRILPTLRALSRKEIELRQQYCQRIFRTALQDDTTLMRSVMSSFRERFMGILPNLPLMDGELNPFIT